MGASHPYFKSPVLGVRRADTCASIVLFMKKYSMTRKATAAAAPTDAEAQPEELQGQPELGFQFKVSIFDSCAMRGGSR